ncbi:MAG: hypothetical protein AAF479_02455 [Pseudomonadota bacterium]
MRLFLAMLAWLALSCSVMADPVLRCTPSEQTSVVDQIIFARDCQTQRTEGFSSRWLASDSKVVLTVPEPDGEYRYIAFWTSDHDLVPALERLNAAKENLERIADDADRKAKRDDGDETEITALKRAEERVTVETGRVEDLSFRTQLTQRLDADRNILFELTAPVGSFYPWTDHHITLIAFKPGTEGIVFASRVTARVVSGWVGMLTGAIFGVLGFVFILFGLRTINRDQDKEPFRRRFFGGQDRRMSLANLQIAWFSTIVLITMSYIVARTGELGELSNDVLLLLGIAAVGSTASKVGDSFSRQLKRENYLLLRKLDWLPERPDYKISQLITDSAGRTDISRVQAVGFSVVVGGYLLGTGLTGLSDVNLPDGILAVLGLSQATYVGMKATGARLFEALDTHMEDLRKDLAPYTVEEIKALASKDVTSLDQSGWSDEKKAKHIAEVDNIESKFSDMKLLFKEVYGTDPHAVV